MTCIEHQVCISMLRLGLDALEYVGNVDGQSNLCCLSTLS